jgi:hypothetical protein
VLDENVPPSGIANEKPPIPVRATVEFSFLNRHQTGFKARRALSQALKALMPLHWICDPTAAFAFSLPPPFFAPLFPSPAVKALTLAPSRRWRRGRFWPDLNRKSCPRLYLDLSLRGLYADGATEKNCGKSAECDLHGGSFRVFIRTH